MYRETPGRLSYTLIGYKVSLIFVYLGLPPTVTDTTDFF